ncbi:hypothetical protein G3I30_25880 [Actinospica acidiphila]|nr:hypothetical protein [Actinospica acidiphila]
MKSDNSTSGPVERLVDRVKAGRGGAMTDEVGVITGDLTVVTALQPDGRAAVAVQYTDADEWYTLSGSPTPLPHPDGLRQVHDTVLDAIKAGGGAEVPT